MHNNYLKWLLLFLIQLLTTGNFLNQFLNDDLIMIISLARRHFNVIITWKHDTFYRGRARSSCLKFFQLTFYFVNGVCLIKFLQKAFDKRTFSRSWWSIEENVREIIRFRKFLQNFNLVMIHWSGLIEAHGSVFFNPKSLFGVHIFNNF